MKDYCETYDKASYRQFTSKSELDKALHTLEGILKGIGLDQMITNKEIDELSQWCSAHSQYIEVHPFSEVFKILYLALEDGIIDNEEKEDILWLCKNFTTENIFYDYLTADLQRLQGILHGILADNIIKDTEVHQLKDWLSTNEHLKGSYPYDEIVSLLQGILADGVIDNEEKKLLKLYFSEFIDSDNTLYMNNSELEAIRNNINIQGLCSSNPNITIMDKNICFTGKSSRTTRSEIAITVEKNGGAFNKGVIQKTDYLIVGDEGNPCWTFSCYGRKVEKAVNMRKEGHHIQIIHEDDFWNIV